ncbi:MAG: transcription-repair coupling factor [Planctomycetales bacterium]|nr:transcription-repair coupling factor [bacterium]UNM07944.1 MAG: transcription-repair coupling factor [Planctomycetales bacterium]
MFIPWPELQRRFSLAAERANSTPGLRLCDLRGSSVFFLLHHLCDESDKPLLVLTETTAKAQQMQQFLSHVERLVEGREPRQDDYLVFPDFEPQNLFEYIDPPVELLDQRNQVLDALQRGSCRAVFASAKACFRLLPPPADYNAREIILATEDGLAELEDDSGVKRYLIEGAVTSIDRDDLATRLSANGYSKVTTVVEPGQFAIRGGLVDIYAVGQDRPARIDLFGDVIESIHEFRPDTQRTGNAMPLLQILPLAIHGERLRTEESRVWLEDRWREYRREFQGHISPSAFERLSELIDNDFEHLENGIAIPRAGWYYRAVASEDCTLWDYLLPGTQVVVHEDSFVDSETNSYFTFWQNRFGDWLKNGLSFLHFEHFYRLPAGRIADTLATLADGRLMLSNGDELEGLPGISPLFTHSFSAAELSGEHYSLGFNSPPSGKWGTSKLEGSIAAYPQLERIKPSDLSPDFVDRPVTVLTQFSSRMAEVLSDAGVHPEIIPAILPGGFQIPAGDGNLLPAAVNNDGWTVVTDMEIFGEITEVVPSRPRYGGGTPIRKSEELSEGDYIVHIDYGIGRFARLVDRQQGELTRAFVEIEFASNDKLFVPVDQLDRLRRYSYDGTDPSLNNLGKDTWTKTKEKVKKDTLELAKKLLSLYKRRKVGGGHGYSTAEEWMHEFAEGFPYTMTEDQGKAWLAVEQDMEVAQPMDRLIVGDVGFGKTEIAMRAAFKACVDERQVLVLCPTTILADQHHRNFSRRFKPFPFKVEMLSRFQSAKEQKEIIQRVNAGEVDIVIATHRGLSKQIDFPRLGLLVVDEEQRFGVKQKENLKLRWPEIDVLTMSATPIPRTLHMSLIGVRDISLIETAPVARKAIKTYVGEMDEIMVREAILRELGRGGQVYYLHNRVADIEKVREKLEKLVPETKVLIAHGQMKEDQLEEVMHAFSLGAYRIMLATTIIENGLDIPTVNTIIVDNAENLGLAQMHQLRGRVGRSAVQAYAFFFHAPNRILTEDAQSRLHAIYNYAYLGAGYEIAQSDLRIRGAGNLLGESQSGLARQVGFDYYCELLARSIKDVKALDEADIEEWDETALLEERPGPQVDLPLSVYIPESYVENVSLRLELLRRLANLTDNEELDGVAEELQDRFGRRPVEVDNLLLLVRLRNTCGGLGIERMSYNHRSMSFAFQFYSDEDNWYTKAPLLDSRFKMGSGGFISLEQTFSGKDDVEELFDALDTLAGLREQAVR